MTTPATARAVLTRAVRRATLAPSIHNTQPWRFTIGDGGIDVFADPARRLPVIDPQGRALVISCGAAVFGARMSLAAGGWRTSTEALPDPGDPDHLARITVTTSTASHRDADVLDAAADRRHTNRRSLTAEPVASAAVAALLAAAGAEHATLLAVTDGVDHAALTALVTEAERALTADPSYLAELSEWAGRAGRHDDGIGVRSIPAAAGVDHVLPGRGFDLRGTGRLHNANRPPGNRHTFLLSTPTDDRRGWLEAGQGLSHVLLELTRYGLVAALFTQLVEVPAIRDRVRSTLGLTGYPHVLLDVGHAEATPATPRRPLREVLEVRGPLIGPNGAPSGSLGSVGGGNNG